MRAWNELLKGNNEEVISLAKPLYDSFQDRNLTETQLRMNVTNTLFAAYLQLGDLEIADQLSVYLIDLADQNHGPKSNAYATHVANSVGLKNRLGQLGVAEARARYAIELYDQIYPPERPAAQRASVRRSLAETLMYSGRFDEALAELTQANGEMAQARNRALEEWEHHYLDLGEFHVRMRNWHAAERDLNKAYELFASPGDDDRRHLVALHALLALTKCHRQLIRRAGTHLDTAENILETDALLAPLPRALVLEARAFCLFQKDRPDAALPEIDSALELEIRYSGRAMHQADRRILRARILAAMNRTDEAALELDLAEQAFLDLDLSGHPHFPNIDAARRELALD